MVGLESITIDVNGMELVVDIDDAKAVYDIISRVYGFYGMDSTVSRSVDGGNRVVLVSKDRESSSAEDDDNDYRRGDRKGSL